MTEEEAKQKWCPFANVYVAYQGTGASGNRGLSDTSTAQDWKGKALCIGSACMAWRWSDRVKSYNPEYQRPLNAGEITGHCGLAGKP